MRVRYYSSFDRTYRQMRPLDRNRIESAIGALLEYLERGGGAAPPGLGLKKLRQNIWEARVGLALRIVFTLDHDLLSFILVGKHDAVRRFLRRPS